MTTSLGDRMKINYELPSRRLLNRRTPVIVRVDGNAFHTFTRNMYKPFDPYFVDAMVLAAKYVVARASGVKLAYVQSDEASFLLTDYDTKTTEPWFGYVQNKIESITASMMTAVFNAQKLKAEVAYFDARAFNIPREEVANYFLWRSRDWHRNSLNMYAETFYSHGELHGKSNQERHEMLHRKGKNWATDLSPQLRNGTWIRSDTSEVTELRASYKTIAELVDPLVNCDIVQPAAE